MVCKNTTANIPPSCNGKSGRQNLTGARGSDSREWLEVAFIQSAYCCWIGCEELGQSESLKELDPTKFNGGLARGDFRTGSCLRTVFRRIAELTSGLPMAQPDTGRKFPECQQCLQQFQRIEFTVKQEGHGQRDASKMQMRLVAKALLKTQEKERSLPQQIDQMCCCIDQKICK